MIVSAAALNGRSGSSTSGTSVANCERTPSVASKFAATSGCTPAVAFFRTPTTGFVANPRRPAAPSYRYGASAAVGSLGSGPAIASSTRPQSSAVRHIGPSLSIVHDSAIAPCRLTRPYVGRSPLTAHAVDGNTIEPHVSLPIANGTSAAPTAAPGPLDEPPDQYSRFHGVRPGPVNDASAWLYPIPPASSTIESLATSTAPAALSRSTTVASKSKRWFRYGSAPHVVL